jgi:hypothetical protein
LKAKGGSRLDRIIAALRRLYGPPAAPEATDPGRCATAVR